MIRFDEWMFPDGEAHLLDWMRKVNKVVDGRLTYQYSKYEAAMNHVKQRRVAVDVGSHIGLWGWVMARDFDSVVAFEPMPEHRECWKVNLASMPHAVLHPYALGNPLNESEIVCLDSRTPGSSGDTAVNPKGIGHTPAELRALDSFNLEIVDFLKIDCEGYEVFVLKGAVETLQRCKPVIIVEQKPHTGGPKRYGIGPTDAVLFLESLGYRQRKVISGDYIMSHDA